MTIPTIIYLTPLSTPRILYGEKTYKIAFPQEGDVPAIADVKEVVRTVGGEQAIEIRLRKFLFPFFRNEVAEVN